MTSAILLILPQVASQTPKVLPVILVTCKEDSKVTIRQMQDAAQSLELTKSEGFFRISTDKCAVLCSPKLCGMDRLLAFTSALRLVTDSPDILGTVFETKSLGRVNNLAFKRAIHGFTGGSGKPGSNASGDLIQLDSYKFQFRLGVKVGIQSAGETKSTTQYSSANSEANNSDVPHSTQPSPDQDLFSPTPHDMEFSQVYGQLTVEEYTDACATFAKAFAAEVKEAQKAFVDIYRDVRGKMKTQFEAKFHSKFPEPGTPISDDPAIRAFLQRGFTEDYEFNGFKSRAEAKAYFEGGVIASILFKPCIYVSASSKDKDVNGSGLLAPVTMLSAYGG